MTARSQTSNSDLQIVPPAPTYNSNREMAASQASITNLQLAACTDTFHWRKMESLKFLVQVALSAIILTICACNLPKAEGSDKAIYWGGISSILAWWAPSPAAKNAMKSEDN